MHVPLSERARVMRLVSLTLCHKHALVEENDSNSKQTDGGIMFNIMNLQQTIKMIIGGKKVDLPFTAG